MQNLKQILSSMFASATKAQLKPGDKVPAFTLKDQHGTAIDSRDILGIDPVVIFFYPKDDTPGCTREACAFRDHYTEFTDAGVRVIGVSSDDVASHSRFSEKYKLPYTLLSDRENKLRNAFAVESDLFGLIPGRVTFVVDAQGIIRYVFNSQMNAEMHIREGLKAIQQLKEA